jgi:hypothetical protein
VTGENGLYQLPPIASGSVVIQAQLDGFKTVRRALALRGGATTLDLTMEVGALTETVTVSAEPASPFVGRATAGCRSRRRRRR